MTEIRCPACGHVAEQRQTIEDTEFDWSCPTCFKTFEVRIVFLTRTGRVDLERFRAEVRTEMQRQRLTQAELGRLIGVSGAYISTILSGKREVSKELADRVRAALRLERKPAVTPSPGGRSP